MKMKFAPVLKRLLGISGLCGSLLVAQCSMALEWKMPLGYSENNLHTELAFYFARQLQRETDGQLIVDVVPDAALFKSHQVFGAVRRDLVPIGGRLLSGLAAENPLFELDAVPFLATNYTQAFKLYSAAKPELEKALLIKGVKLLYAVPWPAQGLYSRSEVERVSDFSGFVMRPYSQLTQEFASALGVQQKVLHTAQINRALKRKELDLLLGSAQVASEYKLSKTLPFWYDLDAWLAKEVVVVNLARWNALAPAMQAQLMTAARQTENRGWARSKEISQRSEAALARLGVARVIPSDTLRQEFALIGQAMLLEWLERTGDVGRYVLERYQRSL